MSSLYIKHSNIIFRRFKISTIVFELLSGYIETVCNKSIIDCKEITKKDINAFLNQKLQRSSANKSSIQKILEEQGIG